MPPKRAFHSRELFENPAFRPDGLKLYPTLVIRGTGLYELWKTGKYRNYPPKWVPEIGPIFSMLVDLTARTLSLVPPWMRVYRIQAGSREFHHAARYSDAFGDVRRGNGEPASAGAAAYGGFGRETRGDERQGLVCRDIRMREVGIQDIHKKIQPTKVELIRRDYAANGG